MPALYPIQTLFTHDILEPRAYPQIATLLFQVTLLEKVPKPNTELPRILPPHLPIVNPFTLASQPTTSSIADGETVPIPTLAPLSYIEPVPRVVLVSQRAI